VTKRHLRRLIRRARHDQQCAIALAVEVMASAPYGSPSKDKSAPDIAGYVTGAVDHGRLVDAYLDRLAARLGVATAS
jgi:hypothetical protein